MLNLLKYYEKKTSSLMVKTVAGFKSDKDVKTQLPCDRAESPTSLDLIRATAKEQCDNPHHRHQVDGTRYQVGRRPEVKNSARLGCAAKTNMVAFKATPAPCRYLLILLLFLFSFLFFLSL